MHPLIGMSPRAETITFWARSRGRTSSNQLLLFLMEEGGSSTYSYDFQLSSDWRQYSARIADFKPANPVTKNQNQSIIPARVRQFYLECGGGSGSILELQIDSLRVEAARK